MNWKEQQKRLRRTDALPRHFCERCTALCADTDGSCLDCGAQRPSTGWTPLEEAYDPFLGRVLNKRYVISKIEGRGSSSTIYRADALNVSKRFAIKMVKLWHTDPSVSQEMRARLEREVRAVGMMRNPHIVRVYELLELDRDWIALVMDHIEGHTLEEQVDTSGPLTAERACGIIRQVANGLSEAHQAEMIHRDVKPANIMIEQLPDGGDFAFLLDFGVVRLDDEAHLTKGFLGTPLFASPEQAVAGDIDHRSDIYSLGATLFYLLTGRAPFDGERTLEVLKAHINQEPPTLSQARADADFPAKLERLVARMLAKSPADRPADLLEVVDALGELDLARRAQPPGESAGLTNGLVPEDSAADGPGPSNRTLAFQSRPKTIVGLNHTPQAGTPAITGERRANPKRARRDSGTFAPRRDTNPPGFARPSTNPGGLQAPRDISVQKTVQFLPESIRRGVEDTAQLAETSSAFISHQPRSTPANPGIPFARSVRAYGACTEDAVAFVDTQNEVWTIVDGRLEPMGAPRERITSLMRCSEGIFVGLADGTIARLDTDDGLQPLHRDRQGRAIEAIATTNSANALLAATSDGTMYMGMLLRDNPRWLSLDANRAIAAVAMSPTGGLFSASSRQGSIRVAAIDTPGKALAKLVVDGSVVDLAFSNDGHLLAVLLDDGRLPIFQTVNGHQISELRPDCPLPDHILFTRADVLHGLCNCNGRITRYDLNTAQPILDE